MGGRLRQLEALFSGGPVQGGRAGHTFSIETLIDILLVLYDECCNSSLRREKTVSDFIEFGELENNFRFYISLIHWVSYNRENWNMNFRDQLIVGMKNKLLNIFASKFF